MKREEFELLRNEIAIQTLKKFGVIEFLENNCLEQYPTYKALSPQESTLVRKAARILGYTVTPRGPLEVVFDLTI